MTKHDLKELAAMGAELGAAKAEVERLRGLLHGAHDTISNLAEDLDEEEFQATIDQLAEIELALGQQQAEPECDWPTCECALEPERCKQCDPSPTDTYTAVEMATAAAQGFRDGQAAVEQAAAQDERESPVVVATAILGGLFHGGSGPELGEIDIEVCTPALETIQCATVNSSDDVFLPLMTVAQHERIVASLARPAQYEREAYSPALTQGELNLVRTVLSGTVTDELVSRVTSALVTRPAQTEQQSVLPVESEAWLQEWARGKFTYTGAYKPRVLGQLYGNTDWALARALHSAIVSLAPIAQTAPQGKFRMGDLVRKTSGSEWEGRICGTYYTALTQEGYAVESEAHAGSVQIYPAKALEAVE